MVLVIVVIACWAKARSAILRLFFAMRMLRVFTEPKPFSNCCEKPTNNEDCTDGLNKFASDVEELRVLSQAPNRVVPVWNPSLNCVLNVEVWSVSRESAEMPVPVPEVRGLFTGTLRSSMLN